MASGELHALFYPNNSKRVTYKEYKLQPTDRGKGLRQIAREQLYDENLFTLILKMRDDPTKQPIWEEIVTKDNINPNWTLLLPPSDYERFVLMVTANVSKAPNSDIGNIHAVVQPNKDFIYKKSSMVKGANGAVWVDVTRSDNVPNKAPNTSYWICVTQGNFHYTRPEING